MRFELNEIPEIHNKIFPTNAPEGEKAPYLVYFKYDYNPLKTFEGIKRNVESAYLLNILCSSYEQLHGLTKKVKEHVMTFPLRTIGTENIYVQDINIRNVAETYENELKLYRSIIDIEISYKEV